jgi:hypothetical protein
MRNTLRLLGIIALVAVIGFGLIACNDGSTSSNDDAPKVVNKKPLATDYIYYGFDQLYDGTPKAVTIVPKNEEVSTGAITIYYDGRNDQQPPTGPTTGDGILVEFDVAAAPGWDAAHLLLPTAGRLKIGNQSVYALPYTLADFDIWGLGTFKQDQSVNGVVVKHKNPANTAPITVFYNNSVDLPIDKENGKRGNPGEYIITIKVAGSTDWIAIPPPASQPNPEYYYPVGTLPGQLHPDYQGMVVGTMTIFAAKDVDVMEDFFISGYSQLYDYNNYTSRYLKIIPKAGKTQGTITQWFEGTGETVYTKSLRAPWIQGTYKVTIDVTEWENFKAIKDKDVGTLTIKERKNKANGDDDRTYVDGSSFMAVKGKEEDVNSPFYDTYTFKYNGQQREVVMGIVPDKDGTIIKYEDLGKITYVYAQWSGSLAGTNTNINYTGNKIFDEAPVNAGTYLIGYHLADSPLYKENVYWYNTLTINKITPVPSDFKVELRAVATGTNAIGGQPPYTYGRLEQYDTVNKNNVFGPYTYKNTGYEFYLSFTDPFINEIYNTDGYNNKWARFYKDGTAFEDTLSLWDVKGLDAEGNPIPYEISFDLDPNFVGGNFETHSWYDIGKMLIVKATPSIDDFTFTKDQTGGTYKGTITKYAITARGKNPDGPFNNVVTSDGKQHIKYSSESKPVYPASETVPTEAGKYTVTMDLEGAKNWHPTSKTWELGTFTIGKAEPAIDFKFKDSYFVQSAYTVELLTNETYSVTGTAITEAGGRDSYEIWYYNSYKDANDVYQMGTTKVKDFAPQDPGQYYVRIEYKGNDNWNAANVMVPNAWIIGNYLDGDDIWVYREFGLVVNPIVIKVMPEFEEWYKKVNAIRDKYPGIFAADKVFHVVFNLTDPVFNTTTYDPNHPYNSGERTMVELMKDEKNKDLLLYIDFNYSENYATTFSNDYFYTFNDKGAFEDCTSIARVRFPDDLRTGDFAFRGCTKLEVIEGNLINIGDFAFVNTAIKELALTESLITIGNGAFANIDGNSVLNRVYVPYLLDSDGNEIPIEGTSPVRFQLVDAGLTTIRSNAFDGCNLLKVLTIPATVTDIGDEAFKDCPDLREVTFLGGDPIDFGTDAFYGDLGVKFNDIEGAGGAGMYTRFPDNPSWTNQDNPRNIDSDN